VTVCPFDGILLTDIHEEKIPPVRIITNEAAEEERPVTIGEVAKECKPLLQNRND
jgi:hypothetical protein